MLADLLTIGNYLISISGLFSDFDGTLSKIEKNPRKVTINKHSQIALINLSKYFVTGIISGRPVFNVKDMAAIKNIYYIGNHGAEIYKNNLFVFPEAKKAAPYIENIYKTLNGNLGPPLEFDFKKYSASVHYRNHPQPEEAKKKIYALLKGFLSNELLEINDGRMVVEIRIKGINKATALKKIILDEKLQNFIYFGDDSTDIDIFKMNEPKHLNLVVKNNEARSDIYKYADVLLDGPEEVAAKLREILDKFEVRSSKLEPS